MAGPEPEPDASLLLEGKAALQAHPSVEVLPPAKRRRRLPLGLVQDDDDGKGLHACRRKDVASATGAGVAWPQHAAQSQKGEHTPSGGTGLYFTEDGKNGKNCTMRMNEHARSTR